MTKDTLAGWLSEGLSTHKIAELTGKSQTTVYYWVKKHALLDLLNGDRVTAFKCKFCGTTDASQAMQKGGGRTSLSKCKSCHNRYTVDRFRKNKEKAVAYKGGKCELCGYRKSNRALHFHHLDPAKKDPNWVSMKSWLFERIIEEIDKCQLLCSNCHAEVHDLLGLGEEEQ